MSHLNGSKKELVIDGVPYRMDLEDELRELLLKTEQDH